MCSYRVSLTVGHESESRADAGAAGAGAACSDWRLYVRGARGEDISCYVSKIVFTLHRSYTYPKRVIQEPPYEIRESGHVSFEVPIYIYIKHSTRPSKIKFRYKLLLQNHKAVSGSQRFSHVFEDPPEPVKSCLIQGGAKRVDLNDTAYSATKEQDAGKIKRTEDLFDYKYKDLFETEDQVIETLEAKMDSAQKVVSVNLNRVSEDQLKRKNYHNMSIDKKRRRTDVDKYGDTKEYKDLYRNKESEKNISGVDTRTEVKKFTVNGDVKIRTPTKVKVEKPKLTNNPLDSDKLNESVVVDSLKKACKMAEMSPSETDFVSGLYISIRKYEKSKASDGLKLPSFSDPILYVPELPAGLQQMLDEMEKSDVMR